MSTIPQPHGTVPPLGRVVLAVILAAILGGVAAAPLRAEEDWRRHEARERHERQRHERDYRRAHRGYVHEPPAVVAVPPAVVYAPPPPPAIFSLVFPLQFR